MSVFTRFFIAVISVVILVLGGTFGYALIEGWPLGESLYMTFITFTTVGFGEVRPLSDTGRHFTIVFLIFSIVTVGYSFTTLITYIFEGLLVQSMRERRMFRNVKRIRDHYIVCGCGDTGREVVLEFQRSKVKFVVIDVNPEESELARDESILFIKGDAADDEVLVEANIEHARGLIAVLPNDEANVFVVLTARQLNSRLMIVAQAGEERTIGKLMKAGANRVISPKQIAGRRLASIVLRPTVVNFLDIIVDGVDGVDVPMRLEEVSIDEGSPLIDKSLRESGLGQSTGALIVGIHDAHGRTRVNPTTTSSIASAKLRADDILIALGSEDQIDKLKNFVKSGK
jgi:voltage-gated potassium channel